MFENLREDIGRYTVLGTRGGWYYVVSELGLWATVEYRFSNWVLRSVRFAPLRWPLRVVGFVWHKAVQIATGIDLPPAARIGRGLYIGHFGGIIVSPDATLGEYCNLSQGVTIGIAGRGDERGAPVLGARVYVGPGAKVIGRIRVGDRAALGANAVVTKDVPDGAVAVGVPAKVISFEGSGDFVIVRDRA